jgi:predicted anti-sigma-YlaC factor YlaD
MTRGPVDRDCWPYLEAISARADGEAPDVGDAELDAHLLVCDGCSAYAASVVDLSQLVEADTATRPVPDLTAELLTALDTPAADRRVRQRRRARLLLVAVGLLQLAVAVAAIEPLQHGHGHVTRDLGTWQIALAGTLMYAAWRPHVAVGLLPMVVLVAAAGVVGAVADVTAGVVGVGSELSHLTPLLAIWPLRRLSRDHRVGLPASVAAV